MARYLNYLKLFVFLLIAVSCIVSTVSAAFPWNSTGGGTCWTYSDSTYNYVMINATGVDSYTVPSITSLETLIQAPGGGGGSGAGAGGGGAGGLVITDSIIITPGSVIKYQQGTRGSGGAVGAANDGTSGGNTLITINGFTATAIGGAKGAATNTNGYSGGSGSGAGGNDVNTRTGGSGTSGQGKNGGNNAQAYWYAGGGGGGNQSAGSNGVGNAGALSGSKGGDGGNGYDATAWGLSKIACGGAGAAASGTSYGGVGVCGEGGSAGNATYRHAVNDTGSGGGASGDAAIAGGNGSSGVIILKYSSTPPPKVASFSSTNVSVATNSTSYGWEGNTPFLMRFTNTSSGYDQTSWVWSYTETGSSTTAVFNSSTFYETIYSFSVAGNYTISLNATGSAYTNISTQLTWVNTTLITMIYPSFTANVTSGTRPLAVQFTDTSTNSNATPDAWSWNFGDGNTSILRNPEHLFVSAGVYNVTLSVTNYSFGTRTTFGYIDAIGTRGVNVDYHTMYPRYNVVVSFTDSDTGSIVPYVLVSDSNGYSTNATTGVYSNTYDYSTVTIYYSASGYAQGSRTFAVTGDTTKTIAMTPTGLSNKNSVSLTNTVYATLHFTEGFGDPISGVIITAVPYNTSMGDYSYLESLLGIPLSSAAIQSQTMYQISGSDGKGSFYVLPTTYYKFSFAKSGYTFNPSEIFTSFEGTQDIYIVGSSNASTSYLTNSTDQLTAISYSVETAKINSTSYFLNVSYEDTTGSTTSGTITITQKSTVPYTSDTVIASVPITSSSEEYSTVIHSSSFEVSGTSALVVNTERFGNVQRDAFYTIKGQPVSFMGFGGEIALLFALFIMMMTVMLGTAGPTARQVTVAGLCAELWIFYAIGWFQSLIDRGVSEQVLVIGMIIVSIMAIVGVFELRKKKEKY